MPRSSGCRQDVVFFRKKTIFIFSNLSSKSSGWHGALSMRRIMLLSSWLSLLLSFDRISIRISLFIHAFDWLKYSHGSSDLSWIPLKHLGFANLPMMIGFSFPPLALTKNAHVRLPSISYCLCNSEKPQSGICLGAL